MRKCILIFLFIVIAVSLPLTFKHYREQNSLTLQQKLEDFNYTFDILEQNYPYFWVIQRKFGIDYLGRREEFEKRILLTKNDAEFYEELSRMIRLLQNPHTFLISPEAYDFMKEYYSNLKGIGSGLWKQITKDEKISESYREWKKKLNNRSHILPFVFKYVEGKYVKVDGASSDYIPQVPDGSYLTKIESVDVDEYVKSLAEVSWLEYDERRRKIRLKDPVFPALYKKEYILEFVTPEGNPLEVKVKPVAVDPGKLLRPSSVRMFETSILKEGTVAYIKFNSFNTTDPEADRDEILKFFQSIRDYPFLIIDVRGNTGGNSDYWKYNIIPPLTDRYLSATFYKVFRGGEYMRKFLSGLPGLKNISELPENLVLPPEISRHFTYFIELGCHISEVDSIGFKGEIYILVDEEVFSTAETFVAFAKATKWATIVGTRTGGDGMGSEKPAIILPNSRLVIMFQNGMALNPDGSANAEFGTEPDIFAELTYEDYLKYLKWQKTNPESKGVVNPYDTVINKVLEIINQKLAG
ncbi:MAG: S41 family peptidase [Thermosediminibacteraceae bacterium]|nr:S41 family peptidase [Thermosediminibacteraceae bacterium]